MSTVHSPAEATAPAAKSAPPERRTLVQRMPLPVFVIGYGALVIALVVMVAMLASYQADAKLSEVQQPDPQQAWNPAVRDEANVRASVRGHLIKDAETAVGEAGVMLRGTIADGTLDAEPSRTELAGHLSRLLEQNCLDTVTLTSDDNMKVHFWDFCFKTVPEQSILTALTLAYEEGADAVTFINFWHNGVELAYTWANPVSDEEADALAEEWKKKKFPLGVDRMLFTAYTDDEIVARHEVKGESLIEERYPTGEAFKQQWGM